MEGARIHLRHGREQAEAALVFMVAASAGAALTPVKGCCSVASQYRQVHLTPEGFL